MDKTLVFEKRVGKHKHLVRFWSNEEKYGQFVAEVEKNDLLIQDVFNQFLGWFTDASREGTLQVQESKKND